MPPTPKRHYPVGAELQPDGGVHFRVWAPDSRDVAVELQGAATASFPLTAEPGGYFSGAVREARAGSLYRIRVAGGAFPDPASRRQPQGPHGPSEVVDPHAFRWTDQDWRGRARDHVLYELHLGTFTPEGTWTAAVRELPALRELGVTTLEIMPIAEFAGEFGWGYDGVDFFAPYHRYGPTDDAKRFIDRAHALGLAVILDVVYNHLGPDGNYLKCFAADYFSRRRKSEWGESLNFDEANNAPVREFIVTNARYWIAEYHFDGLRLDATQQIFDDSTPHILADITRAARAAAPQRAVFVVAENEPEEARMVRPEAQAGFGMDALWNDDFHHAAMVAATGRAEAYYSDYRGTPQEFVSALKYGFLFQGQWYGWQRKCRGAPAFDLHARQFVVFLQNHDQVANSLRGQRLHQVASPAVQRALTAVLLLGPQTPMLFQGQEFSASAPFRYFADHNPELRPRVARGRHDFVKQFPSIACDECSELLSDPGDRQVFEQCRLDSAERERHAAATALHTDLLRLRRDDPTISAPQRSDGAVLSPHAFLLRYFGENGADRLLLVNQGSDLACSPSPEPLLAPPTGSNWEIQWSSESPRYGGNGTPPLGMPNAWNIPGRCAILLRPGPLHATDSPDADPRD